MAFLKKRPKQVQQIQRQQEERLSSQKKQLTRASWWILLAILLLVAGIRYRLLDVPMERDEGEYAYAAQLILQGLPPYEHLYNMKLPGVYAAYAVLLSIFGHTHTGVHAGLLLMNAATAVLIFLLARRLLNPLAGLVAAGSFAVLSVSKSVQGVFANAEHFVILPAVGGLLLLLVAREKGRSALFFASGLLLGLGFIMKQHGIAFILAGGAIFLTESLRGRPFSWKTLCFHGLALGGGMLLPYAVTCLIFVVSGSFGQFWFWTFEYARTYASQAPLVSPLAKFQFRAVPILKASWPLWTLAGIGLSACLWNKEARKYWPFLMLFALFSFLAICPRFSFRPHYFILLLPAVAVLAGVAVSSLATVCPGRVSPRGRFSIGLLIAGSALAFTLFQQRAFLFRMTPFAASRYTYGSNPFPESLEIASYIRAHTTEDDRIAVIGSEPQIYFYSGRRAATGYIYTYAMMENHDFALEMQEQMIEEVESAEPMYIVHLDPRSIPWSWVPYRDSHWRLYQWFERYKAQHYTRVGLVDMFRDSASYRWDAEARGAPRSRYWVEVLRRNP